MPTAAYNKALPFTLDLINGIHDFDTHVYKVALSNAAPSAAWNTRSQITELATGGGYTQAAPGLVITFATNQTGAAGTARAIPSADITITASGGSIGPFRYVWVYDDTATAPADALVCYFDRGESITLGDGEPFVVDFDNTNAGGLFGLA